MKKFLALFLAVLMMASLVACGGGETTPTQAPATQAPATQAPTPEATPAPEVVTDPVTEPTPEPAVMADPEEIPYEPLYANSFEDNAGLTAVRQAPATEDPTLTGATYALIPSVHEVLIANDYGVVGSSLMLDGKYGVSVDSFPKTEDDTYTIAFWYAADRYSQYGPLVQMGHNVGMNDTVEQVAWINFTKADAWSVTGEECAPVAWNRNSMPENGVAVWPWIGNNADLKGKREWVHVALVVDGEAYVDNAGAPHVGATMYVNGIEAMKADSSVIGVGEAGEPLGDWMGVAPDIFTTEGVKGIECLLGVNYWDQYSKEYIDEFYFYDEALTAGQVATLATMGTAPEYQTMPKYEGPEDEEIPVTTPEPVVLPEIAPAADAIDTIGSVARDNAFWTDTSDGFELKDGGTVTLKFNNYSAAGAVFQNPVFAYSNTQVTTDLVASAANFEGYFEYGVTRMDGIAGASWGDHISDVVYDRSWTDDAVFMEAMKNATVTAVFSRAVGAVTVNCTIEAADGSTLTETISFNSDMAADSPCFVHITNEFDYIELLSVE